MRQKLDYDNLPFIELHIRSDYTGDMLQLLGS